MLKLTKSWLEKLCKPFDSSMLYVGEMMECEEDRNNCSKGEIVVKISCGGILSLKDLRYWIHEPHIKGRKLLPGESITLTQE